MFHPTLWDTLVWYLNKAPGTTSSPIPAFCELLRSPPASAPALSLAKAAVSLSSVQWCSTRCYVVGSWEHTVQFHFSIHLTAHTVGTSFSRWLLRVRKMSPFGHPSSRNHRPPPPCLPGNSFKNCCFHILIQITSKIKQDLTFATSSKTNMQTPPLLVVA